MNSTKTDLAYNTSTPEIDAGDYSIDLLRHARSGERYVAKMNSLWNAEGDCIGFRVTAMAGPLNDDTVAALHADPHAWTAESGFDLEGVSAEFRADGEWRHVEEIYSGHR